MKIVLCCGKEGRAVIVGNVKALPKDGEPVRLTRARMVLYWDRECGGLLGLAANGPRGATRITAEVSTLVETSWQACCVVSTEAAKEIDSWKAC